MSLRKASIERLVHAVAALGVGVLGEVTRKRGHDLDLVPGEKLGQVLLARREQDSQVAAIDDPRAPPACLGDQPAEMSVQLGRSAGDIHRGYSRFGHEIQAGGHRFLAHDLAPVGTGVDVAVLARLVANLADIDLQDGDSFGPRRTLPVLGQGAEERSASAVSLKDLKLAPRVRKGMPLAQQGERLRHGRAFHPDVDRKRERTARSSKPAPGGASASLQETGYQSAGISASKAHRYSIGPGPIEPAAAREECDLSDPRAQFTPLGR